MNSGDSELLRSSHAAASMTFSVRTSPGYSDTTATPWGPQLDGHVGGHLVGRGLRHAVGDVADVLLRGPESRC